ncbi:MAG: extracellular solute-binding protein, partial [Clostridiales bacterium]|nr:extracellular solute-binding protein [Clostridiales bacterium]
CSQEGAVTPTVSPTAKPEGTNEPVETVEPESDIKWSGTISYAPYMFGPIDEDEVTPQIEEALLEYGYDVKLEPIYIENSQYTELINLRITSKEAPDLFISGNGSRIRELYDQGAIASWDKDFFIEKSPAIYEHVEKGGIDGRLLDFVDMWWDLSSIDGQMVTIPSFTESGSMINKAVIYRQDWLDNLGITELPYTIEEFSELMYKFAKEDPDGNGQDDTYGYSASMIGILFGAHDGWNGYPSGSPQWYNRDSEMISADILPTNIDVLALLAEHYADGLLDPEFITGENQGGYWAISHPFINGRIGVSAHASIDHYRLPEVLGDEGGPVTQEYYKVNGEGAEFTYGPFIAGPTGNYGYLKGYGASLGEGTVYDVRLNNDTEKLSAIFEIKNIFATDDDIAMMAGFGIEGKHYEMETVNGKEIAKALLPSNEELNAKGVMTQRSLSGEPMPFSEKYINFSFYNNPSIANRFDIQSQEQYGGGYISDLYTDTESTALYRPDLITYRDETFTKIITGELGSDYWDTYVEEWNNRGGKILTEEAQEFWNSKN